MYNLIIASLSPRSLRWSQWCASCFPPSISHSIAPLRAETHVYTPTCARCCPAMTWLLQKTMHGPTSVLLSYLVFTLPRASLASADDVILQTIP